MIKAAVRPGRDGIALENVQTRAKRLPLAAVLHAVPGWGKTSLGAQAPAPIFLMTARETGLWTLQQAGLLGDVAHFPHPANDWLDVRVAVQELLLKEHPYKTFVLDVLDGAEALLHAHVCTTQFNGDWGERGFASFGRGPRAAVPLVRELLDLCDQLRTQKGMSVLFLCHSTISKFQNPLGSDYDRFTPALHRETWPAIHGWADLVLFGGFETHVDARPRTAKGKAEGGNVRMIYTERTAAIEAKNRFGLPPEVAAGASPAEAWANLIASLKGAKPA